MKCILLLLLLCGGLFVVRAEPLYPAPSQATVDSLTHLLQRSAPADTARINLLLQVSAALIERHEQLDTKLEDAETYSQQALALSKNLHFTSGIIRSLQALGRVRNNYGQKAEAQRLLQEALRLSQQQGTKRLAAASWMHLANTYSQTAAELPQIIRCLQQAMQLYHQLGDNVQEAYLLESMAGIHALQGNSALAVQEVPRVLALYRAGGYLKLHYAYNLMLYAEQQLGDYQAAMRYGHMAVESALATRDTVEIELFYTRLADVYKELNQLDEALRYYTKALRHEEQLKNRFLTAAIAGHASEILIAQQKPRQGLAVLLAALKTGGYHDNVEDNPQLLFYLARCYAAVKDNVRAEKYYIRMLKQQENKRDIDRIFGYHSAGKFYLLTQRYDEARFFLQKAQVLATKIGTLAQSANIQFLLFKTDSAQARWPAAVAHYQQYKALNDSIFNATKSKQIAALQIQYDTRKKEQNIVLLTKQNQAQQANIRRRETQRNATLGGAVLLSLLLGVSYNRYRIKQRSNHLLEVKQLEINQKNQSLERVIGEKEELLVEKEGLLGEKEELLLEKEGLLVEKEWMLKEIHHRVKNNLQIVSEILSSQIDRVQAPSVLAIIRESQNRVQAMALVHQKLYQSQNLSQVDMQEYIRELVDNLLTSFDSHHRVQAHLAIAPAELDVALATPLGLIINEAVTNSLKYAFPNQPGGAITIMLNILATQRYQLVIADDGVGLPGGFDLAASRSMGLTMIKGLSEQIDAELTFGRGAGVRISLEFEGAKKSASALS